MKSELKNQFDIWRFHFPEKGEHPVVLISHPNLCANAAFINVLYCTSQRQSRPPKPHEVLLNDADGFDWETFCDCSRMYLVDTRALSVRSGRVSLERRLAMRAKIRDIFRLAATD
ncbi:MAG: type II toxin-antitoxin system PemK/MazF family toxin [Limisphaerales bacterium]